MNRETYQTIKTAAPKMGTLIGILWILSFIGIANSATNALYSMFGFGIGIGSLFCAVALSYQFRWITCKGSLSFTGQWLQVILMLFYACILMAMGIFLYMRFLDNGGFASMYTNMQEMPEQKIAMESMLAGSGVTIEDLVSAVSNVKPIDFALQITESNMMASILLSPIIALASRIRSAKPVQ